MSKYTAGPWRYVRSNGSPTSGEHMISGARHGYLAEVRDCGSGDVIANARLIAAAPELLEALDNAALGLDDAGKREAAKAARAVIVKALGGKQ